MKYTIVITLLVFCSFLGRGQDDPSEGLLQLSGVVVSGDSLTPVPFSSVIIRGSSRGTICDYYGFFSLVVRETDTITFSSVGYRNVDFIVPDTLQSKRYSIIQLLQKDTITLPEQKVYPWPSKAQFEQAFLTLNAPTDDYDRAFENMTREDVRLAVQGVPMSAQGNYNYVVQQEYTRLYNQGLLPQISLLNPLAWAQFIEAWKKGDFKSNK
ncbi:MAG: carboxypeptidase-like regulatory domain-containing protein [Cryomorphaceae bacterium]